MNKKGGKHGLEQDPSPKSVSLYILLSSIGVEAFLCVSSSCSSFVFFFCFVLFCFSRQSFSVALEPIPELALVEVDQAGLELTEIQLSLPPKCWD